MSAVSVSLGGFGVEPMPYAESVQSPFRRSMGDQLHHFRALIVAAVPAVVG